MTSMVDSLTQQAMPNTARIALASVVTHNALDEFLMLKFSFELFQGPGFHWFLRCDPKTASVFAEDPYVHCSVFSHQSARKWTTTDPQFLSVVVQKMNSMSDAWNHSAWEAVAFLDADLVVTGPLADCLLETPGELLLTPHYWNSPRSYCDFMLYGYYNSGFVMSRNRDFPEWWREAFVNDLSRFTDQECLNDARARFEVVNLGQECNVGNWRNPGGTDGIAFSPIPPNCLFLHVHLFQPDLDPLAMVGNAFHKQRETFFGGKDSPELFTPSQTVQKMFALHCLKFLRNSTRTKHRLLLREILRRDRLCLYSSDIPPEEASDSQLFKEDTEYQVGSLTLIAPAENPLREYQATHLLYDRFLPFLSERCQDDRWIVDVGANIGDTLAAMIQNSSAKILSIEAHREYFAYLQMNIGRLDPPLRERARCRLALVGTGAFRGELEKEKGSAKLNVDAPNTREPESLTALLQEFKVEAESLFLLKTDTDGFDGDILVSAAETLEKGSPLVFFENQPETDEQIAAFEEAYRVLAACGYVHFWFFDNYGNLMLEDISASVIPTLNRYLQIQNRKRSTRSFYYFDVLAAKAEQAGIARTAVSNYIRFCCAPPGQSPNQAV